VPGYSIVNLMELDDVGAFTNGKFEGRFAREVMRSEHLGVSLFRFADGERPPFGHRHAQQEEVYVVLAGAGRIRLDDETVELAPGDVVRVAPAVVRAFEGGSGSLHVLAFGSDQVEGDEGERIAGFWPRD
jgi:quercetin dioxygenase-like cupin family protein